MYTGDVVDTLKKEATKYIFDHDRLLYLPFFEAAEIFCSKNNIILGGFFGIECMLNIPLSIKSFYWELYCKDTFIMAKKLADVLSMVENKHIPANTTMMQTNIRHREFTISINTRVLFKFYALGMYHGNDLIKVMKPSSCTGLFTKQLIKCISEEIQLILIYQILYSPTKFNMWKETIENEKVLYNIVKKNFRGKISPNQIHGGNQFISINHINDILLTKFAINDNVISIGEYAMFTLKLTDKYNHLQFICNDDIDVILQIMTDLFTDKHNDIKLKNIKIVYTKYSLNIPSDFRITKYTLYLDKDGKRIMLADIFNASSYEMIPYILINKYRIANPWVLLRFMFIDIWTLRIIINLEYSQDLLHKIYNILTSIDIVREYLYTNLSKMFQVENYTGVYVNETVAKKKLIKEIGDRFPNYYPCKNKKEI